MSVKVKFRKDAWWVYVTHRGRRRAKKVGDKVAAYDVARKLRQKLAESDFNLSSPDPSPTFRDYATKWLESGEAGRKASTHRFYSFNLTLHILPAFGHLAVSSIKRSHCRTLLAECRTKGLKPASMRGVNRTLSVVLSQAVEDELLPANPSFRMGKYLRTGDELPPEKQPLSRDEAFKLLAKSEELFPAYHPMFLCALRTGVRLGELVEIKWSDIDFNGRSIHIQRSFVCGKLTSTKTKRNRRVDMSLQLTETLRRLRTSRREAALKSGSPVPEWVFVTPTGCRVDPDNLRSRVFYPSLTGAGLRRVRLHDLRHTYASLLIQQGESLAYIQRQMGHSSIKVTVDVYGHLIPNADRSAVDKLDAQPICNPGATGPGQDVGASAVSR